MSAFLVAKTENTDRRASPMVNVARRYFYPFVGLEVVQIQQGVFGVGRRFSVFQWSLKEGTGQRAKNDNALMTGAAPSRDRICSL